MAKKVSENPTRNEQIEFIVGDLRDWEKWDAYSFWDHVQELERAYLSDKSDKELKQIYEELI